MQNLQNKARLVLVMGILFNLSVGMLYTWSILRGRLQLNVADGGFGWTSSQGGLPFTIAVVFFALGLLIGGRIQDKTGPRWVVTAGGFMVGLGMIISGLVGNSPVGITLGFGVVSGLGIGLGYGCVTPPALKWFHPSKKGMVSGLIVGGFGFGAVYFGPLASSLIENFGIQNTFIYMGIGVIVLSVPIAQFIKNPPAGYVPVEPTKIKEGKKAAPATDYFWREMIKTPRFFMMFIMFAITSSVGLMIIGNVNQIAAEQMGVTGYGTFAFLVSFMAITNMLGRIIGGFISDRIGQINTLFLIFIIQLVNMIGFIFYNNFALLIIGVIGIGMCFGALLSVFPALTAAQFGLKNYGANYGIVYLAWGLSGVIAPVIAAAIYDATGNFLASYIIAAAMMVVMIIINIAFKANVAKVQAIEAGNDAKATKYTSATANS